MKPELIALGWWKAVTKDGRVRYFHSNIEATLFTIDPDNPVFSSQTGSIPDYPVCQDQEAAG